MSSRASREADGAGEAAPPHARTSPQWPGLELVTALRACGAARLSLADDRSHVLHRSCRARWATRPAPADRRRDHQGVGRRDGQQHLPAHLPPHGTTAADRRGSRARPIVRPSSAPVDWTRS